METNGFFFLFRGLLKTSTIVTELNVRFPTLQGARMIVSIGVA